jgi:quercetin dioxygenase-like cupin family protein
MIPGSALTPDPSTAPLRGTVEGRVDAGGVLFGGAGSLLLVARQARGLGGRGRLAGGASGRLSLEGADPMLLSLIRRWSVLVALAVVVALAPLSPSSVTLAAPAELAPPQARPTTSFEAWFEVEQPPPSPFEAVQLVVDFPVGARVARHVHGGPGYITMLDNEMTMWIGADPGQTFPAGASFVEPYRVVAEGANLSPAQSSLLVTYLIPVGAAVTTLEQAGAGPVGQLPPGAVSRFESRMRIDEAPARYKVGQMLRTYELGASAADRGLGRGNGADGCPPAELHGRSDLDRDAGAGLALRQPGEWPGGCGYLDDGAGGVAGAGLLMGTRVRAEACGQVTGRDVVQAGWLSGGRSRGPARRARRRARSTPM